jgi:Dolichyl-phosphate-mannose-protein mannosyltransferase
LLIGDFAHGRKRMAAAALLLLTPCYTLYAFKYNANSIFLSIWPFTLHYFIRSIDDNRRMDAVLFGVFAGLALLSKYYSVILLATCFIAALAHPRRNEYFASASPYLSALVAGAMFAPHVWWLLTHHAPPVHYLASMSGLPWSELARYVGLTVLGALEMNAVMLLVVVLVARTGPRAWLQSWRRHWSEPRFRLLAILVLAPLILTLLSALLLRTRIYADMLVGIFPLAPLLAIDFFGVSDIDLLWSASSRIAAAIVVAGLMVSPAISHFGRHSANIVPYRDVAFEATRLWRLQTGSPLAIVTSDSNYELATAFYSPDRPQALIGFSYDHSLWLTPADIATRGLLSICPADRPRCVAVTAKLMTPESTTTRVTLAPYHRGRDGKSLDYFLTVIPPYDARNKFAVLDEARCRQVWAAAVGGKGTLPGDKAGPYITNIALAETDNDTTISQQEFMNACKMGLVRTN